MSKVLRFEITDKCNLNCEMCWSTNWKHEDMEINTIKNKKSVKNLVKS